MAATADRLPALDIRKLLTDWWPGLLGFAALAVPTIKTLAGQAWVRESGAHGPIVLVTGLWLLARQLTAARASARQGALWLSALGLILGLAIYVFGRVFDFISLETLGLFGVGVAMLHSAFGVAALVRNWFPLFYLGFAIPPPGWLIDKITAPLKQFVSEVAMRSLYAVGLPVSRQGVTIYVSKYQLLMEDACSGMNSLVGLTAISLLYIYLLRGSSIRYSLLMTAFVIPIAIFGNILRVMILILLTYFFGDEVAQGFLHYTAGFLLFAIDLVLVFAVDSLLVRIVPRAWRPA
ncbi:exosortase V [Phenylobacterium sp.]|uniref:exosortase V n=1 Tax=Phenylobacterium sp. TaxID=1871053 RepID=UPI0026199DE2|nr:exosortase V [Phenylobacterium sp.]